MKLSRRRYVVASLSLAATVVVGGSLAIADSVFRVAVPTRIAVQATPIVAFDNRDPTRIRFGALEFSGGLALTSDTRAFGGLSALHIEPDGSHLLAVSDKGSWLRGRIVYRDGKPERLADAEMAPILGPDGKTLASRGWYDTESLTQTGGQFYIGIERVNRIVRLDYRRDGFRARGRPIPVPDDFKTFSYNKSLECLAAPPKGSPLAGHLIAVAEHSLDKNGNHRAYVLAGSSGDSKVVRFSVKRSDDFDVSDCTILPPGDLLLLERSFSFVRGVGMRIRRVPLASIKEGALVDGRILISADLAYQIDNMEGIAVHRTARGETMITLISDDNFSAIQRNLLLQFKLVE
ncbi:MAG: twin-arginine translocation pathway signal [Rhodopseudomonas sp.]|nr:twin-arginine translocation pathway signal [Rhodopseudomonas sp.]